MTDYRHGKLENRIKLQRMHKLKVLSQTKKDIATKARRHEEKNSPLLVGGDKKGSHKGTKAQKKIHL